MILETLAIGDELLTGRTADTNSTFVADRLFERGFRLDRITVILDDDAAIDEALRAAEQRADVVICFGGLGPTSDDRTVQCVARWMGCTVVTHKASREKLEMLFKERGRAVTPQSLKQAEIPEQATAFLNSKGFAPGFHCRRGETDFFFLPGVPEEMKAIFTESILPRILARSGAVETVRWHRWKCLGIPESELQRLMDPIESRLPQGAWLGYRTTYPENHLTLYAKKGSGDFDALSREIATALGNFAYTDRVLDLPELIGEKLLATGRSLVLVESCTGGLTTHRLTQVPGSSAWVWGGIASYQLEAKSTLLGVEVDEPASVSADCSKALAQSARNRSGCPIAAAVTGYMGPHGGTAADPIGTFYVYVEGDRVVEERTSLMRRDRTDLQWAASTYMLYAIWKAIR